MERGVRRTKTSVFFGGLILLSIAAGGRSLAQTGGLPVGSWRGSFPDGSSLTLVCQDNGDCMYAPSGAPQPVVGRGSWQQTAAGSGILTITYLNVGFVNRLYYSITWVNANTIVLSDPSFRLTMTRQ